MNDMMSYDQIAIWVVNVVVQVTCLTVLAVSLAPRMRRSPTARYWLLCTMLIMVLLNPVIVFAIQCSGKSWWSVSLLDADAPSTQEAIAASIPIATKPIPIARSRSSEPDVHGAGRRIDFSPVEDLQTSADARVRRPHDGRRQSDAPPEYPDAGQSPIVEGALNGPSDSRPRSTSIGTVLRTAIPPLLCVWLAGTAVLLLRFASGCYRLAGILRTAMPLKNASVENLFAQVGRELSLKRLPELFVSHHISGPISTGLVRPRIILPENLVGRVTPQQLRDILVHEVAHIVRHDLWIVLGQNLAAALFWPHPLVRLLNRQLALAREEVCDNFVLVTTDAPSYSRTLLALAQLVQRNNTVTGTIGLFTSAWKLEDRVAGLLDASRNRGTQLTLRGWAFVGTLALSLVALTTFATISVAVDDTQDDSRAVADVPDQDSAAADRAVAQSSRNHPDDGLVTLNLTVRMPDGSPARGASVQSSMQGPSQVQIARADESGRATIRAIFGWGALIHASSSDGKFQATLKTTAQNVRTAFARPVELTLAPGIDHQVIVTSKGRPVEDAQVVAEGFYFKVSGTTGRDGVAKLILPADVRLMEVAAWHSDFGVAGACNLDEKPQRDSTKLVLQTPAPLTVRIIDPQSNPVRDLEFCVRCVVPKMPDEGEAIMTHQFAAARLRTNEQGEATVPWAPYDNLGYVNLDPMAMNWTIYEIEQATPSKRVVTVHVSRLKPVTGRLIMPEGTSAEGLLITGHGFRPGAGQGDGPQIRARRDGTFVINAASNYGYILGLFDRDWACEPWTGMILKSDDDDPAELALVVRRATPVTVRVTRGSNRDPVPGAWINFDQLKDYQWVDANGKKQDEAGGISGWLMTDAQGLARCGVGKGKVKVGLSSGKWNEEREIEVTSEKLVEVEFHRPWDGNRKVIARMTRDGTAYQPSEKLKVHAWTDNMSRHNRRIHQSIIRDDRTIEVNFDEQNLSLLAVDPEKGLSGLVKVGPERDAAELVMQPNATYSGTLIDENGKPLADRTLQLVTVGSFIDVVAPQRTDASGKFRFTSVAVGAPLRISIENKEGQPAYHLFAKALFEPGEVREGDQLQAYREDGDGTSAATPRPLAERLQNTCENVRVAGMHAVVVLQGDDSKNVIQLTNRVLAESDEADSDDADDSDDDDSPVYNYLPITVTVQQVESEAAFLKEQNWTRPNANEVVLIALDGRQKLLGSATISAGDPESAKRRADEFLTLHKPELEDARSKLAKGRDQARRDGRRVWVISSGPRCGPCFRLARWIDRYHELLEKDYVIVKVMNEPHADEIGDEIGGANHGIPWFVITEPDGKILVTSEGPLGNMGMPSAVEDFRHFRKMLEQTARRISAEEIEQLIQSLSPKK